MQDGGRASVLNEVFLPVSVMIFPLDRKALLLECFCGG